MGLFSAVRDWVHENYRAAYVIGTGAIAVGAYLLDPQKRKGRVAAAYAATLAVGAALDHCVDPQSQVCGPVVARGTTHEPVVALTFDDGPSVPHTERILDILKEEGVPAAFFCIGRQVRKHPELVERMVREGHLVGNHTDTHPNLLLCGVGATRREIEGGHRAIAEVLGDAPNWFRPPYGYRSPWTLMQARRVGESTALWSICPRDWQMPGPSVLVERTLRRVQPGDIVLLHDGGGDRSQTVEALPGIIRGLRELGYGLVRLDEINGNVTQLRKRRAG